MKRLRGYCAKVWSEAPKILKRQQNAVALLTLVPFMISGIIFAPFNDAQMAELSSVTPQIYALGPAAVLLGLCILTLCCVRKADFAICIVSAAILLAMAIKASPWLKDITGRDVLSGTGFAMFYGLYTLSSLLTVVCVVGRPTVSDWGFRAIAAAMLIDVLLFTFSPGWTVLGPLFTAYFPSQMSVLICFLVLLFFRMIVKFIQENRATHRHTKAMDPRLLKSVRWTTLKLWWPMPLLFVVSTGLYAMLDEALVKAPLRDHLNTLETREEIRVYPDTSVLPALDPAPDHQTVEAAANGAISRLLAHQSAAIRARVNIEAAKTDNTTDAIENAVRAQLPSRFPGTHTQRCGFLDIGCYIKNGIKSMINSAYVSGREAMMADLRRELDTLDTGAEDYAAQANALVKSHFDLLESQTRRRITDTATGLRFIGWAMLIYAIVILMKSQMIVFARVFYDRVSITPADTEQQDDAKTVGRMKKAGSRLEVKKGDGYDRYFFAFRACGNNVVDRRRIPQPLKLALKRLFSRNYMMCLIDFTASRRINSCDLIVDPPAQIVQWDLLEGDEVFVDMRTVIGFSDTCRLDRQISLSLGALIFGRAIYHSVSGPGRLFLRTESEPLAAGDKGTGNIMQGSSLIAWRRDTQFNLVSSLTVGDTFLSGVSIRKADDRGHLVVYDTSQTRRVSMSGGILRLARAFLLPF